MFSDNDQRHVILFDFEQIDALRGKLIPRSFESCKVEYFSSSFSFNGWPKNNEGLSIFSVSLAIFVLLT